jgi:hypothetical protein
VALRVLALPHRPAEVLKRYSSGDGGLLLEASLCGAARAHHSLSLTPLRRHRTS